ncbi:peptidoglycan DD-metalloendopeptidase family protein [Candidatus Omnitrophota bacterium]
MYKKQYNGIKIIIKSIIVLALIVNSYSCVSQTVARPRRRPSIPVSQKVAGGVYHKVGPKETLWRIAKTYSVDLEELVRINRIPDATKISTGQLVLIPGARRQLNVKTALSRMPKDDHFIWPVKGKVITYFGQTFNNRKNKGINIEIRAGENVLASRSGRISFAGEIKGYGKSIIIEHSDNLSTVYTNNSILKGSLKEYVTQGAVIAKASNSKSSGQYFHFEIRKENKPHNPLHYLP